MRIGILPWAGKDQHQIEFAAALRRAGIEVVEIPYQSILPIFSAVRNHKVDIIVLDWVHSFFISRSWVSTLIKSIIYRLDFFLLRVIGTKIIWNMHNLHRHDGLRKDTERIGFSQLAKTVTAIRYFNVASIGLVASYLNISSQKPSLVLPQANYPIHPPPYPNTRTNYGITEDNLVFLIFGGIRQGKGIEKFLKIFTTTSNPSISLVIAGKISEPLMKDYIDVAAEQDSRIKVLDRFIPNEEVGNLFALSDISVLAYENILNSGVLLLSKQYGKPLLVNRNGVFFQEVHNDYAFFFDIDNEKQLDRIIGEIKSSDLTLMQDNARKSVEGNSWDAVAKQFIAFAASL